MMNNVFVGVTTPLQNTSYAWNGHVYGPTDTPASLCSPTPITKDDYQQAIWILVTDPASNLGACSAPGNLGVACTSAGNLSPNACNVAFILDTVCA